MLAETAPLSIATSLDRERTSAATRVEIFRDAHDVLPIWAEIEQIAPCSIYQTRAWLLPWIETLGRKAGLEPFFVVARDAHERCVALLCLGLTRRGPWRVATWLGGADSNFNMPLVRPGVDWTPADLVDVLRRAALAHGRRRVDVFVLRNQPLAWNGQPNPLALLPHQPSPSAAYGTPLPRDAETLFAAQLSKDSRKKLRKKEAKLATLGPLHHLVAATADEQARVINSFIAQKVTRFREKGIVSEFDTPEMRRFIETASPPYGSGIELHALLAGERIVAVYGGASHGGQWSGMFNAFDGDADIARSSPGDLLLMRIVERACASGLHHLDLGIGEARYKAALCNERMAMIDVFVATSWRGAVVARGFAATNSIKGAIKRSPRLLTLARRIRKLAS